MVDWNRMHAIWKYVVFEMAKTKMNRYGKKEIVSFTLEKGA
jgi:hypothetical protein